MNEAKITVPALLARKQHGPKIAMLTAYDATMARLLDEGGADVLLVGDSLGMVVQGLPNTLPVTVEEICYHGRAVARATHRAHVVGDMPFMSYQSSIERALSSAGQMLKTGGFEAVKLEGGVRFAEHIRAIVSAGIPVMGHVGLLPQSVHAMGGFRVQGKARATLSACCRTLARWRMPARTQSCSRASPVTSGSASPRPSRFRPSASAQVPRATAKCSFATIFWACTRT